MTSQNNDQCYEKFAYAVGPNILFRYPTLEDAVGNWHLWMNSPELNSIMGRQHWPNTPEDQKKHLDSVNASRERLLLAIVEKQSNLHIGIASLSGIDLHHRYAQTGLFIGDTQHRIGTYGIEALMMLTEIGLMYLNLNRIYASTLQCNGPSLLLNKILGWREVGVCKKSHFYKGQYRDSVLFEMLQEDWLRSPKRPKSISGKVYPMT